MMDAIGMLKEQITRPAETMILKNSMLRICAALVEVVHQTQSFSAQNAKNKISVPKTMEVTAVIGT